MNSCRPIVLLIIVSCTLILCITQACSSSTNRPGPDAPDGGFRIDGGQTPDDGGAVPDGGLALDGGLTEDGGVVCQEARDLCSFSSDCCAGLACISGACCAEPQSACGATPDCCAGQSCNGGRCCRNNGERCSTAADCCISQDCILDGSVGECCKKTGASCVTKAECCPAHICSYDGGSGWCFATEIKFGGTVWQNPSSPNRMRKESAKNYCWNRGQGWRLPTIGELRSLIRGCPNTIMAGPCDVSDGCYNVQSCGNDSCNGCLGDNGPANGCYWPGELVGECAQYWSIQGGWYVAFFDGSIKTTETSYTQLYVRCVKD